MQEPDRTDYVRSAEMQAADRRAEALIPKKNGAAEALAGRLIALTEQENSGKTGKNGRFRQKPHQHC